MSYLTRTDAREYILANAKGYFTPDKTGKGWICPVCGSGSGTHGTGITENLKSPGHFTCWTGCFENADIFEIIGLQYNLTGYNEQFARVCEEFGVTIEHEPRPSTKAPAPKQGGTKLDTPQGKPTDVATDGQDFTEFFRQAAANIEQTDYHRGISLATMKRFGVGYVSQWRHPKAPTSPTSPRLIIPNGEGYLARDTRTNLTDKQKGYAKQRVGRVELFNSTALNQDNPVFVVEGELDALSIMDVGGQAIALCSVANGEKLLQAVKGHQVKAPLVLALDNDTVGHKATPKLEEGLKQAQFSSYRHHLIPDPFKDANEFLMADRAGFANWVKAGADFEAACKEKERQEREAFERKSAANYINDFLVMLKENKTREAIPTGFANLDGLLDGGLYAGLYFIGAVSSLGKTTLALQIADNVAMSGREVLVFSLEMSRYELTAKSLSRLTFIKSCATVGTNELAKTTRGILRGHYTEAQGQILSQAIQDYATKISHNLYPYEGVGDVGTSVIRTEVDNCVKCTGRPPVIIVDYLQILAAPDVKHSLTDKQVVDKNVLELKRISRDFNAPLIAISSFNRENYSSPVNMTSFKESGAVEYSSDVLIGLQYDGWDYQDGEKAEKDGARTMRLRALRERNEAAGRNKGSQDIQLKVLKNRNGHRGSCKFEFFPAFNYFRENDYFGQN